MLMLMLMLTSWSRSTGSYAYCFHCREDLDQQILKSCFQKKRKLLKVDTGRILTSRPTWGSSPSWNLFARPGSVNPATWWELLLFCLIFFFCCFVVRPSRLMRVFAFFWFLLFCKTWVIHPSHLKGTFAILAKFAVLLFNAKIWITKYLFLRWFWEWSGRQRVTKALNGRK